MKKKYILTIILISILLVGCKKDIKVNFNTNGGSNINELKPNSENKIEEPSNPTKDGYIFKEWTLDGVPYDFDNEVDGNIELEATWEKETASLIQNAKNSLKSIYYVTSRKDLDLNYNGCTFELIEKDKYKKITRNKLDVNENIKYNLTCGKEKEIIEIKTIIKKSNYYYEASSNENKQNYDLVLNYNNLNGNIYNMEGNYLSDLIESKAIINNNDINTNNDFKMLLNNDKDTIYIISKK